MKRKSLGVGAASLLLIFVLLTLTIFGVLSYSASRAGLDYAQALAASTTAYYEASEKAERALADLTLRLTAPGASLPACLSGTSWQWDGELLTLDVPQDDTRKLSLAVRPTGEKTGRGYTIQAYSQLPSGDWDPDDSLSLLS